jgi:hypothetical protein
MHGTGRNLTAFMCDAPGQVLHQRGPAIHVINMECFRDYVTMSTTLRGIHVLQALHHPRTKATERVRNLEGHTLQRARGTGELRLS